MINKYIEDNELNVKNTRKSKLELLIIIIKSIFSIHLLKSVVSHFAYYLFEHVYWRLSIHVKKHVRIHPSVSIRNANNVWLGYDTRITKGSIIWAGEHASITIGDNVLIGPYVQFHATNHGHKLSSGPMTYQERIEKDIKIGNDVWIGGGSVILSGVSLADGIIVAANSAVTKSFIEDNIIIGGVPAKKIMERK